MLIWGHAIIWDCMSLCIRKERKKRYPELKNIIINSIKISIAVVMAIGIANLLQLEFAISAGIVAILTILPTKRETVKTAVARFLAFIIAIGIAYVCFTAFGFNQWAFMIYILPYTFICCLQKWNAAIAMNSVLISHFLTFGKMDFPAIANECMIFFIGVGIGIFINLHLRQNTDAMTALKKQTDEQIARILARMGERINNKNLTDYNGECFKTLEHIIREAKNTAENNYKNQLKRQRDKDAEYIAMRHRQYQVLSEMYKMVSTLETTPRTAQVISDFFKSIAEGFHENNDCKVLLEQFAGMDAYMEEHPLPESRQEFEDRARLFLLMSYIKEFLEIKAKFMDTDFQNWKY